MGKNADNVIKDYIETFGGTNKSNSISADEIDQIIDFVEDSIKKRQLKKSELQSVLDYFRNLFEENAANYFCDGINADLTPYFDLETFRERSIEEQKQIMQDVFDCYIINYSEDNDFTQEEKEEIVYPCRRALNTIVMMAIGYNATRKQCVCDAIGKFAFANDVVEFIVDLVQKNKNEMREIYMLKTLSSLSDRLRRVENTIKNFIDMFDDAEENIEE